MTRSILGFISFQAFVFGSACGPEPVRRGPIITPPDAAADSDAVDEARSRPKLPAPGSGGSPPTIDAGIIDAQAVDSDAGHEDAVDGAAVDAGADAGATRLPVLGDLLVVEVLVNPVGTDTGREWIEIENQSGETLDLSGLHVADAASDAAAPAGPIFPGGRLVLGQSADAAVNGGAPVAAPYGTKLGLNNDGDEVSLCLGPCAGGAVIDHVTWKTLGAVYDGHALVFDRRANRTCAATRPFGTAGDFGTPGEPDNCPSNPDTPDAGF